MALTAGEIQTIITTLEARMSSAAGTEQFQDQRVTWVNTAELLSKIQYFKNMLADVDGTSTTQRVRQIRLYTNNGY